MRSTASYHRGFCSAQKYGPVKISCMQRICTPSFPARSISFRCFSTLASRMTSIFSSVSHACVAWIRPHFTIWDIQMLRICLEEETVRERRPSRIDADERADLADHSVERDE